MLSTGIYAADQISFSRFDLRVRTVIEGPLRIAQRCAESARYNEGHSRVPTLVAAFVWLVSAYRAESHGLVKY